MLDTRPDLKSSLMWATGAKCQVARHNTAHIPERPH